MPDIRKVEQSSKKTPKAGAEAERQAKRTAARIAAAEQKKRTAELELLLLDDDMLRDTSKLGALGRIFQLCILKGVEIMSTREQH